MRVLGNKLYGILGALTLATSADATIIKLAEGNVAKIKGAKQGSQVKLKSWKFENGATYELVDEKLVLSASKRAALQFQMPEKPSWLTPHHETEKKKHERLSLIHI